MTTPSVPTEEIVDLSPFKRMVMTIGTLPTAFTESMTYYEALAYFVKYLEETVIPAVNQNAEATSELQTLYVELKQYVDSYFENLDVQDEINNKLDEMVTDGSFERLLNQTVITDIATQLGMSLRTLGLVGDGVTDEGEALQEAFDTYDKIYVDDGYTFYSSTPITLRSGQTIDGKGKLKCQIRAKGEVGDTLNFSEITTNSVTFSTTPTPGDIIYVYYMNDNNPSDNKRQITKINNVAGKLNNNLRNFGTNYTIKRLDTIKNITIKNITLEGRLNFEYCSNINIYNINHESGVTRFWWCYDVIFADSKINQNGDEYVDVACGSSNIKMNNLEFSNGGSVSDNSALKIDEVFYSDFSNLNFGSPNRISPYNGAFSAIMIDGDFAEQSFLINPSYGINVTNINIADGYTYGIYLTIAENIKVTNMESNALINVQSYSNKCYFDNITCNKFIVRTADVSDINVSNSRITTINEGVVANTNYVNCIIGSITFKKDASYNTFTGCTFNTISNSYITSDSASNNRFVGCKVMDTCSISGQKDGSFDLELHCHTQLREIHNCFIRLNFVDNIHEHQYNLDLKATITNNYIEYLISDTALATNPLNVEANASIGTFNAIRTINLTKCSTTDLNFAMGIVKANTYPTSTSITHYKGEIILNTAPAANGNIGWVCTSTGAPGTWKAFGTIAA